MIGKKTIGVYPMLPDETCWFLAADFDKDHWQEDALAYIDTARKAGIHVYLERSRSGKGGHVWIFFETPIAAVTARKLGCFILTQTMERRHRMALSSYDRLFPNQDTMPKGGFGNLIALPLQWMPRQKDDSVFLDDSLTPYPNQWKLLKSMQRMAADQVDWIVVQAARQEPSLACVLWKPIPMIRRTNRGPCHHRKRSLGSPRAIRFDSAGNLIVTQPNRIRLISPDDVVYTIAGVFPGSPLNGGEQNLVLGTVFSNPVALAVTADGSIYVVDNTTRRVMKLEPVRPPE